MSRSPARMGVRPRALFLILPILFSLLPRGISIAHAVAPVPNPPVLFAAAPVPDRPLPGASTPVPDRRLPRPFFEAGQIQPGSAQERPPTPWHWEQRSKQVSQPFRLALSGSNDHSDSDPRYALYDLLHVDLRIRFDIPDSSIAGSVVYDIRSLADGVDTILLDLVDSLTVTGALRDGAPTGIQHGNRLLTLTMNPPLTNGQEVHLEVDYAGHPRPDGLQGMAFEYHPPGRGPGSAPIVSTLSETNSAPSWWPCKDITYDKFTIDTWLTVPDSLVAGSNGLLTEVLPEQNGFATYHWTEHYPIATYLVSVAISNYASWSDTYVSPLSGQSMPIVYYAYPEDESQAKIAWARTPEMIQAFARLFGEYPFINEKYGMAEFSPAEGMEHQTLTSYPSYDLIYSQEDNEHVVSHELAHQWWGDLVTPATWDDIWLNEGFAVYSESLWEEHVGGRAGYLEHMLSLERDDSDYPGTVYHPDYTFNTTVYLKGAWVLHMLRHVLGDSTFFEALRTYGRQYAYRNATTADLRAVLEQVSGQDLGPFFRSWVFGRGRPDYQAAWTRETFPFGPPLIDVTLQQIQPDSVFAMPVDLVFQYRTAPAETLRVENDSRVQQYSFLVSDSPEQILIDPSDWILKKVNYVYGGTGVPEPGPAADAEWRLAPPWPNPSTSNVHLLLRAPSSWRSSAATAVPALWVADAAGRKIARVQGAQVQPGAVSYDWNGRTAQGLLAPAGTYWVVGEGPVRARPQRLVRIR